MSSPYNEEAKHVLDRILSIEIVRVTERAAVAAARLRGLGSEKEADQAAVDAMRRELGKLTIDGTVVIGEGERDEAPMLFIGENVGTGRGSKVDIAVDPLEGTTLCAKNMPGAIATMAMAESGTLLTGDHVLPSITPHVSGVRKADSLKSYLATLDLVARLDGVTLGLPAHGHPFHDVPGRVAAIKQHHAERMELLRDAGLALGPATVVALSHEVFPKRHWGTMAESETFAHLEHLVHAGEAERWEESGMLVYRMAPAS